MSCSALDGTWPRPEIFKGAQLRDFVVYRPHIFFLLATSELSTTAPRRAFCDCSFSSWSLRHRFFRIFIRHSELVISSGATHAVGERNWWLRNGSLLWNSKFDRIVVRKQVHSLLFGCWMVWKWQNFPQSTLRSETVYRHMSRQTYESLSYLFDKMNSRLPAPHFCTLAPNFCSSPLLYLWLSISFSSFSFADVDDTPWRCVLGHALRALHWVDAGSLLMFIPSRIGHMISRRGSRSRCLRHCCCRVVCAAGCELQEYWSSYLEFIPIFSVILFLQLVVFLWQPSSSSDLGSHRKRKPLFD